MPQRNSDDNESARPLSKIVICLQKSFASKVTVVVKAGTACGRGAFEQDSKNYNKVKE